MEKIAIIGATSFVGKALVSRLHSLGYSILVLSRNIIQAKEILSNDKFQYILFDPSNLDKLVSVTKECDIIINFAGENIVKKKWTAYQKQNNLRQNLRQYFFSCHIYRWLL